MTSTSTQDASDAEPRCTPWRITTAVRVFALALAVGTRARRRQLGQVAAVLVVAGRSRRGVVAAGVDDPQPSRRTGCRSARPLLVAALLLASASTRRARAALPRRARRSSPACATAGSPRSTSRSSSLLAAAVTVAADPAVGTPRAGRRGGCPGSSSALGVGLLASLQSRSIRDHRGATGAVRRRPPADGAAPRASPARGSGRARQRRSSPPSSRPRCGARAGATRSTVFVHAPDRARCVRSSHGDDVERLAAEIAMPTPSATPSAAVVPLRGAQQVLGYRRARRRPPAGPTSSTSRAQAVADEFALRLDTAVLFDDVRAAGHVRGAQPDRPRDARRRRPGDRRPRLHRRRDRVGLATRPRPGQLAADAARGDQPASSPRSASRSSTCATRSPTHRLSGALADYVREVSHATRTSGSTCSLDESGPPLPPRTETELLRVAQEAIGNVRKHARADNLWVTLVSDGSHAPARGRGRRRRQRRPTDRHWGLQTMRERAADDRRRPRGHPPTRRRHRRPPAVPPRPHLPKERLPMSTTVLLVDDHELIRQGLARAFERDDDMTVVGQAGSVAEGVAACGDLAARRRRHRPPAARRARSRRRPRGPRQRATRPASWCSPCTPATTRSSPPWRRAPPAFVGKDSRATEVVSAAKHAAVAPRTFLCAGLSAAMMRRATAPAHAQAVRPRGRGPRLCSPTVSAPVRSPVGST